MCTSFFVVSFLRKRKIIIQMQEINIDLLILVIITEG